MKKLQLFQWFYHFNIHVVNDDDKDEPKAKLSLSDEINEYVKEKATIEPLFYWSTRNKDYPLLAKLVIHLYCIQPASVSSERLFSAASYSVWERRVRLIPSNVDKIMVSQQNLNKF